MNIEHPDITYALQTGYPYPVREHPECALCGHSIYPGDRYYDTPNGLWCYDCVSSMGKTLYDTEDDWQ